MLRASTKYVNLVPKHGVIDGQVTSGTDHIGGHAHNLAAGRADVRRLRLRQIRRENISNPICHSDEQGRFDIAYVCQQVAMFCVKEAARGASELQDVAIARHHFDAALCLVTPAPPAAPALDSPRLLLAG
jgi:hypothetical protein